MPHILKGFVFWFFFLNFSHLRNRCKTSSAFPPLTRTDSSEARKCMRTGRGLGPQLCNTPPHSTPAAWPASPSGGGSPGRAHPGAFRPPPTIYIVSLNK